MSKTYQYVNIKDKAEQGKKRRKQDLQDRSTKQALNQFKQTGNLQQEYC